MRLKNQTAVITGAGSGIGRAIAVRFAAEGANIVIPGRNLKAAQETKQLVEAEGRKALVLQMDVEDPSQITHMVDEALKVFQSINILVTSAGVNLPATFLEFPLDAWEKTLRVNLTGVFLCCQAVARSMVSQNKGGRIINIASIAAFNRYPGSVAYPVSKGGVVQLTRTMAAELAKHKITVNAIAPGTTLTAMTRQMLQDKAAYDREASMIPLNRFANPEEIAALAAFLASEEASYITGECVVIDGGWLMR